MTTFTAGSRVQFTALFHTGGKVTDPKKITATVNGEPVELRSGQLGEMVFATVVDEGPLVVEFRASTGEYSRTEYDVVAATAVEESLESIVADIIRDTPPMPEPPPPFDRAGARRRLMAAGIPVDDAWSDAKMRGALSGLESNERERRAHKF